MAYTSKSQVEDYLGTSLPNTLTTQLNLWITAVQEWIDNYTNTTFESSSETRYYDGNGDRELLVDLFHGTPAIVILDTDGADDVTITDAYVDKYPLNRTTKDTVYLKSGAEVTLFPSYRYAVKITATFGWSAACPEEIKLAATRLLAHLLNKRLSGGVIRSESLGDYSVTLAEIDEEADILGVKNILDQYRNLSI